MDPDAGTSLVGSLATTWEQYGNYVQLLLALLFGWLVLNWLSNIAARVDGLSMTVGDLRKDLDELKDEVKAQGSKEG
jgi:hypothetical protein